MALPRYAMDLSVVCDCGTSILLNCCVALPRYAMDLSVVCDCGIIILLNFESFQACAEMLPAR